MRRLVANFALFALGLAGCGGAPPLKPLSTESVVLCFGDSLTSGVGAESQEDYPAVLAELLGCRVINAGVPGEVTAEGVDRLPSALARHKPSLVVLCMGGNDMLQKIGDSIIEGNLREMVEAAQAADADVVLLGVPRPGLLLKAPPFYQDVAKTYGVPYEAKAVKEVLSRASLKSDMIHPDAEGYRIIAERVAALIRAKSGG